MNAIPAPQSAQSSAPSKSGSDPTMEDILASIRRIIADDQVLPLTPRPGRPTLVEPPAAETREPEPVAEIKPAARAPVEADIPDDLAAWLDEAALPLRSTIVEQPAVVPPPRIRRVMEEPAVAERGIVERVMAESVAAPVSEARPDARMEPRRLRTEPAPQQLLSAETNASVASAFQSLTQSVLLRDPATMENLARDLLRPMLKQWLDDNLPTLVERLVRAEIERVARGGR